MIFEQMHLGGDRNFAYLIGDADTGVGAAVDPAYDPDRMFERAKEQGLEIRYIFNTHGHGDHSNGNVRMKELTGAPVLAHEEEPVEADRRLKDGEEIEIGNLKLKVFHTPGHTPGSISLLVSDHLISGDTLFVGKVGGTGPGFSGSSAEAQWKSLHKLMELPDAVKVFPGHDYYGGSDPPRKKWSTVGEERRSNPFLLCEDFDAFVDLKENWAEYKKKHGIR
jgi:hydroxyacylglutathione hydrolase